MNRPAATPPAGTAELREAIARAQKAERRAARANARADEAEKLRSLDRARANGNEQARDEARRAVDLLQAEVITLREQSEAAERERNDAKEEAAGLEASIQTWIEKLHDGTLHEGHCNAGHRSAVGSPGCSCTLGRKIRAGVVRAEDAESRLATLAAENEALRNRNEALTDALTDFVRWSESYPQAIFPEPDFAETHRILQQHGRTLDAVSAAIMRNAVEQIGARARAALTPGGSDADQP